MSEKEDVLNNYFSNILEFTTIDDVNVYFVGDLKVKDLKATKDNYFGNKYLVVLANGECLNEGVRKCL